MYNETKNKIIALLIAIFPLTSWILGTTNRIKNCGTVRGVLFLVTFEFFFVGYVLDILSVILNKKIGKLLI
jgi:hypothetical protein